MTDKLCNHTYDYSTKLSFLAQWYDYESGYLRNFHLTYFPFDNTLELFDKDFKRMYLRRTASDQIDIENFFVGNTIRVYGRQIDIVDYADCFTKNFISKSKEHTIVVIKTSIMNKLGVAVNEVLSLGVQVSRMRMVQLSRREALEFYTARKGDVYLPFTIEHLISGPIVVMEIVGENMIERWLQAMGPSDPQIAKKTAPECLRAKYGETPAVNAFHGPEDAESALRESRFFFPRELGKCGPGQTATFANATCCVIKPHVIKDGNLGNIITSILDAGIFKITAMKMVSLSEANADEFLEIYKGVIADFHAFRLSFVDGQSLALEISANADGIDAHQEFRKFSGPFHSEVARQIRPKSLRAMYGQDKYENAVHCTDLPDDTQLELEYFFKILD